MDHNLLNEVLPVLGVAAVRIGDFVNDAFVLLDQGGKLIVGKGWAYVRSELSCVASLFVRRAEKITTLGKSLEEDVVGTFVG
jgi:hypothetical protein